MSKLNCDAAIDSVDEVPPGYEIFGDLLALPSDTLNVMQAVRQSDNMYFSKFGLLVRTGVGSTLAMRDPGPTRFFDYGPSDTIGTEGVGEQIEIDECHGPKKWLVFAGGIRTADVGCVSVVVSDVNHAAEFEVDLPVGQLCR